jgi:signal transduction histidine kinase
VSPTQLHAEIPTVIRRPSRPPATSTQPAPSTLPSDQPAPSGQNVTFAHELRRRLAALRVLSEAIEVRTADHDIDRLVHMLVQELHDLEQLESAMLGSPRHDALEDVDVLETAQAAAQTVGWARDSQIKVQGSKRLRIRSNPTMLRQAIENLIDNAATCGIGAPVDVIVRYSIARRLPGIEVLVADRGPGLGRAPATRRSGGGVGLQLVRKFVQEAGGRLWSDNREGGGALFGLWLPAGKLAMAMEARDASGSGAGGGR